MNSHKPGDRTPRPRIRLLFFLAFLLLAVADNAWPQTVARISVNPQSRLLKLNQETPVEIRFTDVRGSAVPLRSATYLTITLTVLEDPALAKKIGEWRKVGNLNGENLVLKSSRTVNGKSLPNAANVIQGQLLAGQSSITITIRSERAGTLRLSVEGAGMITGSSTIDVEGPSRIGVAVHPSLIRANREARLDVTLLDYRGLPVKAVTDMNMTVTVTTLERLSDVRHTAARVIKSLDNSLLVIAKSPGTTRLSGFFPKGQERVSLRLKANFTGVIRIFAEGYGLSTGSTLISTIAQNVQLASPVIAPQMLSFWQPVMAVPALWTSVTAQGRLRIAKIDSAPLSDSLAASREFCVLLEPDSSGQFVVPQSDLEVKIEVVNPGKVSPVVEPASLKIRANNNTSNTATVSYACRGEVKLLARASLSEVESSRSTEFSFTPQRHAAMLNIDASPDEEVANGLRPITLTVTVWDACGATLSSEKESVDMGDRRINFDYRSNLRFDGGEPTLAIPARDASATKKVYSSHRVKELPVIATSADSNGVEIKGETSVTFYFPIWEFIAAIFGGAVWPALSSGLKERTAFVETAKGAVIGVVIFGVALYGAIASSETNLGALSVRLVSLPTDSWLAAAILGFIGYSLITGITLGIRKISLPKNGSAPPDDPKQ